MTIRGIIVLDGPDASGKSTLAKTMQELYGAKILHATYRFKNNMFAYHTAILKKAIAESQKGLVVIDRLWLSEQVYANVFRGGSKWPLAGRFIDRMLLRFGALNVICLPSAVTVSVENHRKNLDPSHPYDDDKVRELYAGYDAAWGRLKYRHDYARYSFDKDGQNTYDYADYLVVRLMQVQALQPNDLDARQWPEFRNFGGSVKLSKTLIVGERSNPKWNSVNWPFYEHGNSSLFLAKALETIGAGEPSLCFMNAVEGGRFQNTTELWISRLAETKRVVCLGNVAYRTVRRLVPGTKRVRLVPHPAYYQRFKAADAVSYERLLWEAISDIPYGD